MFLFDAAAILLVLAAVFGLLNHHVLKLPFTIGLLVSGLLSSFGMLLVDALAPGLGLGQTIRAAVLRVDFAQTVLRGMLSLLLFAGALHTDLALLRQKLHAILSLATLGTVISTFVAGLAAWWAFGLVGVEISLPWCLVFGALISPTDPIAVLGIMKAAGAPKDIEIKIIGESLFNDGVGVVLFTVFVGLAQAGGGFEAGTVATLLGREVLGGIVLGLGLGVLADRAMRTIDEPNLEILITLAVVFSINLLGGLLHISAPLGAVAAGLFLGNHARARAMSDRTQQALDIVWTFLDETLNALLFLLIGIEVLAIDYSHGSYLRAAALLIPLVLLARLVAVVVPLQLLRRHVTMGRGAVRVLTWGGLKGGISIALAMETPDFEGRNAVLTVTYAIVVFSVVVQGLSVGRLVRSITAAKPTQRAGAD
ncbi:MAG TPA: sodium:proton antiporter [Planctomycetota bacterium]|nr:sodium:proton antiporter [Planctomycetota bacterium]